MSILNLPTEILSHIVLYASAAALTRQKRRLALLQLGSVCKAFSEICLRQIYAKLAYEISFKGAHLLSTLESNVRYAGLVRALAIREREGSAQRKLVNSRATETFSSMSTRTRKSELDAISFEEDRIAQLLCILKRSLVELKWESNLLPTDDSSFAQLVNLQSFTCVCQPPFPVAAHPDHQALVQTATFALSLPPSLFLTTFCTLRQLNHLDLWKCSFAEFDSQLIEAAAPQIHLSTLVLQECLISADVLEWLVRASLAATSLRTLKIGYLRDTKSDSLTKVHDVVKQLITKSAGHLLNLAFEGDDHDLEPDMSSVDEDVSSKPSPFSFLNHLQWLRLSGRAITSHHWLNIPPTVFETLRTLELNHTPRLNPADILETLLALPPSSMALGYVSIKGAEDIRRRNIRELLRPDETGVDWHWTRVEYVTMQSFVEAVGIRSDVDRAIRFGNADDDDQPSSDADEIDVGDYDEGDFFVTPEQVRRGLSHRD